MDAGQVKAASVSVLAENKLFHVSATGGMAIVKGKSNNSSTSLAGAISVNVLDNSQRAFILDTAIETLTGDLRVEAARKGPMISVSAGAAGATSQKGIAVAGSFSANVLLDETEAYMEYVNKAVVAGSTTVKASDEARIIAIGGGIAYGGKAGVGLGFGLNLLGTDQNPTLTRAYIKNSVLEMNDGMLEVSVRNENPDGTEPRIIAVGGGIGISSPSQGKIGIGAYMAVNIIVHQNEAFIQNSTITETAGSSAPLNTLIRAEDTSGIVAVIVGVGVSSGSAVGAAITYNEIDNQIRAYLDHVSLTSNGTLTIEAISESSIGTAAVGVGVSTGQGKLAGAGSIAINTITNLIDARIIGEGTISTAGTIKLTASDESLIVSIAGGVSVAANGKAVGAAVSYNLISNQVKAYIEDAVVTAAGAISDILVTASSGSILVSIAVGGAFAGDFALGGSLTVNSISNSLDAHIKNSTLVQAGRDVNLVAVERDTLVAVAGGFAGSSHSSAVGAALAYNYIGGSLDPGNPDLINRDSTAVDQITAYVDNAHVLAGRDLLVSAGVLPATAVPPTNLNVYDDPESTDDDILLPEEANSQIVSITVGGAVANNLAIGGSISVNVIAHDITAYITGTRSVKANGSILIAAADDVKVANVAGGVALGNNAVGAGVAMNITHNNISAYIGAGATVDALGGGNGLYAPVGTKDSDGDIETMLVKGLAVSATSFEKVFTLAVGGAAAGRAALAGSLSTNALVETTKAYIGENAQINMGTTGENANQTVLVIASDRTNLTGIGGSIALGGTGGIGAGIDVSVIVKDTDAHIGSGADVQAKRDVLVQAFSEEKVVSVAAGVGVGGTAGIAGGIDVSVLTVTTQAYIEGEKTVDRDHVHRRHCGCGRQRGGFCGRKDADRCDRWQPGCRRYRWNWRCGCPSGSC